MLRLFLLLVLGYLLLVFTMYFLQRQYIYFPSHDRPQPADWSVPGIEEIYLNTEDDLQLLAWYRKASPGKPTILYLHGNGGHIGMRGSIIKPYLLTGYGILLPEYRGYASNPGKPTEQGLYMDGEAALAFLKENNVPDQCIVLYGESLGSAVAIKLATDHQVGALILQSPFNTLTDVASHHYPYLPVSLLLKEKYDSQSRIGDVKAPVLIIHGENDTIVPPEFSEKLYNAAKYPKKYVKLTRYGHNNMHPLTNSDITFDFLHQRLPCLNARQAPQAIATY